MIRTLWTNFEYYIYKGHMLYQMVMETQKWVSREEKRAGQ